MKPQQTFNNARNAANTAVDKADRKVDELQDRAHDAVDEGASVLSRAVDRVGNYINSTDLEALASEAGQRVGRFANEATRTASDYVQRGSDAFRDTADQVESHIKTKPIQSTLVALGVGYLLARLFDRRAS